LRRIRTVGGDRGGDRFTATELEVFIPRDLRKKSIASLDTCVWFVLHIRTKHEVITIPGTIKIERMHASRGRWEKWVPAEQRVAGEVDVGKAVFRPPFERVT